MVGSNKGDARALHGHTHSHDVLSAGAGLAAQCSVQGAAHLHGHTQEHDVLSAGAGLAAQYSRRSDAAQPYTMPAVRFVLCHVTQPIPFYFCCPSHATRCLSLRSPGHSARARRLLFRGGPSSAPCLSGLWSRHRNTSQLLKRITPLITRLQIASRELARHQVRHDVGCEHGEGDGDPVVTVGRH